MYKWTPVTNIETLIILVQNVLLEPRFYFDNNNNNPEIDKSDNSEINDGMEEVKIDDNHDINKEECENVNILAAETWYMDEFYNYKMEFDNQFN